MSIACRRAVAASLAVVACLSGCGGGSDSGSDGAGLPITELSQEASFAVGGNWPLVGTSARAFAVRNSQDWAAAWTTRGPVLVCASYYREVACDMPAPPTVDFSKYTLIGIVIDPLGYFDAPTPRTAELVDDGQTLYVAYKYGHVYHAASVSITQTRFFLVPATTATLVAKGTRQN